ncbi:MAG: RNA polymerase sigma factor [Coprococcus sp.]
MKISAMMMRILYQERRCVIDELNKLEKGESKVDNNINVEELVKQAVSGNSAAFETLYQQTYRSVYFNCISFLKNQEDALDMTQEVYLTAYKNLSNLVNYNSFVPWLMRITANACINYIKKEKAVLMDNESMGNVQLEEREDFLPEEYITNKAKREVIMNIMQNSLSDVMYQTVVMYYFDGISVPEIAKIMECPTGTVTYRLSAARAKIKQGVIQYENKNNDKLYSVAAVPFLSSLLFAEAQNMYMPYVAPKFLSSFTGSDISGHQTAAAGKAAKSGIKGGSKHIFRTIQAKIIGGVVAVAVVTGGVIAVINHNNTNKDNDDLLANTEVTTTEALEDKTETEVAASEEDTSDKTETEVAASEDTTQEVTEKETEEKNSNDNEEYPEKYVMPASNLELNEIVATDKNGDICVKATLSVPEKYEMHFGNKSYDWALYNDDNKVFVGFYVKQLASAQEAIDLEMADVQDLDKRLEEKNGNKYEYSNETGSITNDEGREYLWLEHKGRVVYEDGSVYDNNEIIFATYVENSAGVDCVITMTINTDHINDMSLDFSEFSAFTDSSVIAIETY